MKTPKRKQSTRGVIVYRNTENILEFFLAQRNMDTKTNAGLYEFIGGKRKCGEAIKVCRNRELQEEIGTRATQLISFDSSFFDIKRTHEMHDHFLFIGYVQDKEDFMKHVKLSRKHLTSRFWNIEEMNHYVIDWVQQSCQNVARNLKTLILI